jgi:hypothetical protein
MFADDKYLCYAQAPGDTRTINRCAVTSTSATCPTPGVIVPGIASPTLGAEDAVSIYWKSTTYLPGRRLERPRAAPDEVGRAVRLAARDQRSAASESTLRNDHSARDFVVMISCHRPRRQQST